MFFGKKSKIARLVIPSDKGEQWAIDELHRWFDNGLDGDEYNKIRIQVYTPLANKGNDEAMYWLGILYLIDNNELSEYWFLKSANLGNIKAMKSLALGYSEFANEENSSSGYGEDAEKEKYWYKKAADLGDPDAMDSYAIMCDIDEKEKREYLERASQMGYWKGMYDLARFLESPSRNINHCNDEVVKKLYLEAAERCTNPRDISTFGLIAYSLGYIFGKAFIFDNSGINIDIEDGREALKWFTYADVCEMQSQELIHKVSVNSGIPFDNNDYQYYRNQVIDHFYG